MREAGPQPDPDDLWHQQWLVPVVQALFRHDGAGARAALAAAHAAPRPENLSAEFLCYIAYRLDYLAFQTELSYPSGADLPALYTAALKALETPPEGALAERMRSRLKLQLRCIADSDGVAPLEPAEFDELLKDGVARGANAEMWYFATGWAFARQRKDVVQAALEFLTVESTRYFADFLWQRVNLMYLLLEGRARKQDVLELIKRIEFANQLEAVERRLWPACEQAGLVDAAAQAALATRREQLQAAEPRVPRAAHPTGRIRRDH